VDVIVVGFGAAGACAALQAREDGAEVLIVDRFSGGGATAYSGGVVYAGGTKVQARNGVADDPETMIKYLQTELGDAVAPETLRRFCEGSAADINWLADHGMKYSGNVFSNKASYPPDSASLYFSGNEKQFENATGAKSAPRGHRVVGKGYSGYVFYATLKRAVEQAGINVVRHAPVMRLVLDEVGNVLGVEVHPISANAMSRHQALFDKVTPHKPLNPSGQDKNVIAARELEQSEHGAPLHFRARTGVILATGGYVFNRQKLAETQPLLAKHIHSIVRLGSIGDDGSGIELGQSAGGVVRLLDSVDLGRSIAPPEGQLKGVAINAMGKRFINEDAYSGHLGQAIKAQPDCKAWLILDRAHLLRVIRQCFSSNRAQFKTVCAPVLLCLIAGGTRVSRTIEGLARKLGVPAENLCQTIDAYNHAVDVRQDPLGKLADQLEPIRGAPYWAINLSVTNRFSFARMFTLSGLRINEQTGAVLNARGESIQGLFAAGRCAVGLCAEGYVSGMSLADCVFSGRRAGQATALRARQTHSHKVGLLQAEATD
jgi:3-oxo-5alpha-steroid 4-dehydrogenase